MKMIALEEHFATPEVIAAWGNLAPEFQDIAIGKSTGGRPSRPAALAGTMKPARRHFA